MLSNTKKKTINIEEPVMEFHIVNFCYRYLQGRNIFPSAELKPVKTGTLRKLPCFKFSWLHPITAPSKKGSTEGPNKRPSIGFENAVFYK